MVRVPDGRQGFLIGYGKHNKVGTFLGKQPGRSFLKASIVVMRSTFPLPVAPPPSMPAARASAVKIRARRQGLRSDHLVDPVLHEENEEVPRGVADPIVTREPKHMSNPPSPLRTMVLRSGRAKAIPG